jgi:hypothetical protein
MGEALFWREDLIKSIGEALCNHAQRASRAIRPGKEVMLHGKRQLVSGFWKQHNGGISRLEFFNYSLRIRVGGVDDSTDHMGQIKS